MSLVDPSWPEGARRLIESQQAIIDALNTMVRRQAEKIEKLEQRVSDLEAKLEKAQRSGKRQAAPFRKAPKKNPKRPGRKSGKDHGGTNHRAPP